MAVLALKSHCWSTNRSFSFYNRLPHSGKRPENPCLISSVGPLMECQRLVSRSLKKKGYFCVNRYYSAPVTTAISVSNLAVDSLPLLQLVRTRVDSITVDGES